jgi:hypothetical protein
MYICKWVKSVGKSDIRSFGMWNTLRVPVFRMV